TQPNNPLHGKTLEAIMVYLVSYYGWDELGEIIRINSFRSKPSIKSSLKFLRRTEWAREKVEKLFIETIEK
ncbi:MAG: DNA-binding protein VF530, partial [Draconibacterium sp.]|nr:DNA-binding protein VF530 [Draconibacterium sp.]